jgi:hypothetical protein
MRLWLLSFMVFLSSITSSCGAQPKLSQNKIRDKIQQLNLIDLKDDQIAVGKVSFSGQSQAVAEANVELTFHLSKSKDGDWNVDSIRMGDRDWVSVKDFQSAMNEVRAQRTRENLQKLRQAMERYREKNGDYPQADNTIKLTDILFPAYISEAIRYDGWNHELIYKSLDHQTWKISSSGPDGIPGDADDIVVGP